MLLAGCWLLETVDLLSHLFQVSTCVYTFGVNSSLSKMSDDLSKDEIDQFRKEYEEAREVVNTFFKLVNYLLIMKNIHTFIFFVIMMYMYCIVFQFVNIKNLYMYNLLSILMCFSGLGFASPYRKR